MEAVFSSEAPFRTAEGGASTVSRVISSRPVAVWLAGFLFLCFAYFLPHTDWNQTSRLDLTVAIADHRTIAIDEYQANTGDKDFYRGHYYALKSPGQSFVGLPVYLLYKASFALRGGLPADRANDYQLRYLEVVCTVAIPSVLFLLLFFWFLGYFSASVVNRALLTLGVGLGTMVFTYSQNLYAHVPVAGLLFAAFVLLYLIGHRGTVHGEWTQKLLVNPELAAMLAGLALGMVVFLEYSAALIVLLIGIYALLTLPRPLFPYLVVGALPPLMMLGAYNSAAYGNPFTPAYTSGGASNFSGVYAQGTDGFIFPPSLAAIWGMSFSPFRGLFFQSPFLLLAVPGWWLWSKRNGREWLLFLAIAVGFFLNIAMFTTWWAGYAAGPRYLIPMLPFLAFPIIFVLDWVSHLSLRDMVRDLVYGLIALSIAVVWAEGIPVLWPQEGMYNPLFTYSIPFLQQGALNTDLGATLFQLSAWDSVRPLPAMLVIWTLLVFGVTIYRPWTFLHNRAEGSPRG